MAELNPVLVKELRGRMRGARAFILLTAYLGILGVVTVLLYIAVATNSGNSFDAGRQIGQALFYVIAVVALIQVCMITPALTAGSIAGEKERQTYDLLIASQLTPFQIIWGKMAAALAFALLLIVAVVPLMSLAFLFGGVSLTEVLIALLGMVVTAICYASVGLFWSTVMRSTLGANSFALGSIILGLLGIPFVALMVSIIFSGQLSNWLRSPFFATLSMVFLSLHPFIALALTEGALREGQGTLFVPLFNAPNQISLSPWLWYSILSLGLSAILLLLSARSLRRRTSSVRIKRRRTNAET